MASQTVHRLTLTTASLAIPERPTLDSIFDAMSGSKSGSDCRSEKEQSKQSKISVVHFSLVIPTYNECDNLARLVTVLTHLLDRVLPGQYELIVVDDDSPDRTWELAEALAEDHPQLRVLRRQNERGLSTAVVRGWQMATGQVLGVIDGDLQHPPEVLEKLLEAIAQGADLAVASRHVRGGGVSQWSFVRRLLSRGAQLLGLVILPQVLGRLTDPMSGYFLVRRGAIAGASLSPVGYKILLEVVGRGNIGRIAEVGYVFQERRSGDSKVTWRQYIDYLHHLIRLRLVLMTQPARRPLPSNLPSNLDQVSPDQVSLAPAHLAPASPDQVSRPRQPAFPRARFLRFCLVGLTGVALDMLLLRLLFGAWGFPLNLSLTVASELAIINNFIWNDRWTFGDIAKHQRSPRQKLKRFAKFNVVCLMGLVLKILLVNLLVGGFRLNVYDANAIAILAVTFWNFWINLKLSWRVTES
jgi:dolichol-phosphate mannosyltransferase